MRPLLLILSLGCATAKTTLCEHRETAAEVADVVAQDTTPKTKLGLAVARFVLNWWCAQ